MHLADLRREGPVETVRISREAIELAKVANLETGEETGEEIEEEEKSPCGGRFERRNLGSVACGGKHVAGQTDGEV